MAGALVVLVFVLTTGCAGIEQRAYYPPDVAATRALAETLYRAAQAAGDEPARYSFALLATRDVSTFSADDATFCFSEGLARQPQMVIDAMIAREVLGHAGQRRALTWSLTAGFTALGIVGPGAGLLDFAPEPAHRPRVQSRSGGRRGPARRRDPARDGPRCAENRAGERVTRRLRGQRAARRRVAGRRAVARPSPRRPRATGLATCRTRGGTLPTTASPV